MLRLKTFGTPIVERDAEPLDGAARQRRVLALLAIVASGRQRGVSRDRVLALLWAESEPEKARQALTQSLYHTRRALAQDDLFIGGADLTLNAEVMTSDLAEFEEALEQGHLESAVELYRGPFLDGFHVSGAPEFERWVDEERSRLVGLCVRALEQLAAATEASSDPGGALAWRRRLAGMDPYNSRVALDLMRSLAAVGDRAAAIRFAETHEALLRHELDAAPHPAIVELARDLRETPTWQPPKPEISQPPPEFPLHDVAPVPPAARNAAVLRRRRVTGVVIALSLVVIALLLGTRAALREPPAVAEEMIVVAPFRVSGADPALAFLREGLVDLLVTTLPGDGGARAADAGAVMSAWRRAGYAERPDIPRSEALTIASQLRATRLLTGSVVGIPSRLVVSASLFSVPSGDLRAQATVTGSADSLTLTVDRLVARLLAKEAGEYERLSRYLTSSVPALRAYLDGQAAYRRGLYRNSVGAFRRALAGDPSFAMAGLALAMAAERIDAHDDRARGLAVAWAARASLSERDSVFLHALAGPSYPAASSPREQYATWERATIVAADRADVWHELGERLFFDGRLLGIRAWATRARAAFTRAADLDPAFASPLQYLVQIAAAEGDTAAVRRFATAYFAVDSMGDLAAFVRWRSALALGQRNRLRDLQRELPTMPAASLRAIALSSQYNGIALDDAERVLSTLVARAARGADRVEVSLARHALALNRGDLSDVAAAIDALPDQHLGSTLGLRLAVLDFLYADGDSVQATTAASSLDARLSSQEREAIAGRSEAALTRDACVVAQWQAGSVSEAIAITEGTVDMPSWPTDLCTALVRAMHAMRSRQPDAQRLLQHADSLHVFGPSGAEEQWYVPLALARMYESLGDVRRALVSVRRRPHMRQWPHYLASHVHDEGRLSLRMADTASTVAAFRHYLALRESADQRLRGGVDSVRAELMRLTRKSAR
jgi:DNA-binding SARP family transcriptional activator